MCKLTGRDHFSGHLGYRTKPIFELGRITTAADDKFCDIFSNFRQQTILMKYHPLFVIFEKAAKLKLSSAANYRWRFMG